MNSSSIPPRFIRFWFLLISVGLSVLSLTASAQSDTSEKSEKIRELNSRTQEAIEKVQPLLEAQNWEAAIPILQGIIAKADPKSYDMAISSTLLAQVYLQRAGPGDYTAAIPYLERSIALDYFDSNRNLDFIYTLGQLYLNDKNLLKAAEWARIWFKRAPLDLQTADKYVFLASVLLQLAEPKPGSTDKSDPALIKETYELIKRGFRVLPKPNETMYVILSVCYQQLGRTDDWIDLLEVLISKYPKDKQYWLQLYGGYLERGDQVRAILTLERAQAVGFLTDKKDNEARIGLYWNLSQHEIAAELLEKGFANATIEPSQSNYELLAGAYNNIRKPEKAIDVYVRAGKLFKGGKFDAAIANLYWSEKNLPLTIKFAKSALEKGDIENPGQLALFAAYVALELERYPEAKDFLAVADPLIKDNAERSKYEGLKKSVDEAAERAAKIELGKQKS